jgi:indolepyruvate ferredoxin oxidoreductase
VLGYRKDRRDERELVSMYVSDIKLIKEKYGVSEKCNLQQLIDLPDTVRGFGPIKSESLEIYKLRRKELRSEIHAIN